jgi:hypothetical protein
LLIACLRLIQSWTLTSILSEFRLYSGPKHFFDLEQLIERYDKTKLDRISSIAEESGDYDVPEYLVLHKKLMLEEKRLFESLSLLQQDEQLNNMDGNNTSNNGNNSNNFEEVVDSFQIMNSLFFSNNQMVLSDGISYDRQLRLVKS